MTKELEGWIKAVKKLAHEQAEAGVKIEGYKLVNKRATRVWNDVEAVMKKVRLAKKLKINEACDIKLKSPPQLEKLCKTKKVDFKNYSDYITAVSTGTTLVKEDDKRPEALPNLALKALADRL